MNKQKYRISIFAIMHLSPFVNQYSIQRKNWLLHLFCIIPNLVMLVLCKNIKI